jgi:parallel beta-helix repeat protein
MSSTKQNRPYLTSIYAGFVSNIEIRNINIKGCANAIQLQSVSKANIHQTTISGYPQPENTEPIGINLMSCEDTRIDQNLITENYIGILVQWSTCTITNNTILNNSGSGITLDTSGTTLTSNLIAKNDLGIEIQNSDNTIQDNDIISNKRIGILIGAPENVFVGNNIAGQNNTNAYGIQMNPHEGGNTFRHNDFETTSFMYKEATKHTTQTSGIPATPREATTGTPTLASTTLTGLTRTRREAMESEIPHTT